MVRALASHVSRVRFPDPVSYVGWVCCWFSPSLRGFFSGFSGFPPSSKINISKFQFDREFVGHGFMSWRLLCVTLVKQSWLLDWWILSASPLKLLLPLPYALPLPVFLFPCRTPVVLFCLLQSCQLLSSCPTFFFVLFAFFSDVLLLLFLLSRLLLFLSISTSTLSESRSYCNRPLSLD